ncbi:ScyD/ScyE family protein [Spirosoma aureum]|uniref:ScyD/ScyE family protein n=2 Tax=Spirosoma aureum TaxID=2692134 RepID=A0A6G9AFZ5_9BACT|nr:ScyD/ScyE family protein [Spirosoma aureum]
MIYNITRSICILALFLVMSCQDHIIPAPPAPALTPRTLATNLVAPISVETDASGRVFVAEQGTGHNDGSVSEITQDGVRHPIITNIYSVTNTEGDLDAVDHLLVVEGTLYFLNPKGLYKFDLSTYKTGASPIMASSLIPEDIRKFVLAYNFTNDTGESHLYNLTQGPDGALYITDAAANAIIRRSKTGELSVVTEVPGIVNPNPAGPPPGPPFIQAVPTSITHDGRQFLITTLLGFPFPAGRSIVYQMDLSGKLTIYQQTFNSLVDVENDGNGKPLVLEFALFGPMGFTPNTGRLLRANGTSSTVLLDKLNMPTDLKISNTHTAYITSMGDGALLKITF